MRNNFDKCLAITLEHEGGWSDHPADPGGATMKGVTMGRFRQYHPTATKADLRAISNYEVRAIYKADYWDKVRGDDLPPGLDLVAFDAGVNSGPAQGAMWLQRALGVADDGKIGPITIAAAKGADAAKAIDDACDRRMAMLRGLKTWPVFGVGWSRRVNGIRAAAKAMTI